MMKRYGFSRFIGGLFLMSAVLALPTRAQVAPTVVISEINWGGSEASIADEWIELVNLSDQTFDLSGWVLTGTATSGGAIQIEAGTTLEPGSTLLISNYPFGDAKTTLNVTPDLVTTAISLPNSNLEILLTMPDGLVIDSYIDTGTPDFGSSAPAVSIARDLTTLAWQSSPENLNLINTSQLGTPSAVVLPSSDVETTPEPTLEEPVIEPPVVVVEEPPITVPAPTEPAPEPEPEPVVEPIPEPEQVVEPAPEPEPSLPTCVDPTLAPETTVTEPNELTETTELETPVVEESPSPAPVVEASPINSLLPGQLIINELVSDPIDSIEWVELRNVSSQELDLTGSTLVDAGDHTTNLPAQTLASGGFVIIENPSGNLNNTGDTLTIFDSYGTLIDTLTYGTESVPTPEDGESVARTDAGTWLITTATKGTANVFPEVAGETDTTPTETTDPVVTETNEPTNPDETVGTNEYETPTDNPNPTVDDSGTSPGTVEETYNPKSPGAKPIHRIVAFAKSLKDKRDAKTTVRSSSLNQTTLSGPVVALPDTFGKQIAFIDGYEIYFHAADWPELKLGDVISVTGTPSTNDGAPRLKISKAEDIQITGHVEPIPLPIDGSEFESTSHGQLVSISGQVVSKESNQLLVMTDDGVTIPVLANKKTGVSWSSIQTGSIIVTGVVRDSSQGLRLAVRSQADVHYTPSATISKSGTTQTTTKSATPWVGGGLLTGSLGALGTWYLRSRKGIHLPF